MDWGGRGDRAASRVGKLGGVGEEWICWQTCLMFSLDNSTLDKGNKTWRLKGFLPRIRPLDCLTRARPARPSQEAFDGKISRATDVWALGVVIWEMVVGKRPYEAVQERDFGE